LPYTKEIFMNTPHRLSPQRPIASIAFCAALLLQGFAGASALAQGDNWTTPLAAKLGVRLEKQLDSSGPDAWDPKQHPLVFLSTEGPGYGGLLSGVKLPGLAIFDADSRKVVASRNYDVLKMGFQNVFEPHGLGVSPDGKWIYLPTGEGSFETLNKGAYLIINARTLKVDKVVRLQGQAHHASAFKDEAGRDRVLIYGWNQPPVVLDPKNDNRVVGGITFTDMQGKGYLYFIDPQGKYLYGGGRIEPAEAREEAHENVLIKVSTRDWKLQKRVALPEGNPVWVSFTADNKTAYISGAHTNQVFRYDTTKDAVTGTIRAGVEGPYGVHLGWDDKELYTIGKGEGSHNRGKVVGYVQPGLIGKTKQASDQFATNCVRGDHGTLHPNPDANEMWITCNSSFEIVVLDLDQKKVTERIPMPNGGSTHSGAFVQYDAAWNGQLLSDHNGLHGTALEAKRKLIGRETK
jgi:DNA-binding beta-propeller fold protein YncE